MSELKIRRCQKCREIKNITEFPKDKFICCKCQRPVKNNWKIRKPNEKLNI